MAARKLSPGLLHQRWIHSFEEDSAETQVYRLQSWDFPLSRRPRDAFELRANGTAHLFLPGAADRPEAADASWAAEKGELVIRAAKKRAAGPLTLGVVESSADKLLVRRALGIDSCASSDSVHDL